MTCPLNTPHSYTDGKDYYSNAPSLEDILNYTKKAENFKEDLKDYVSKNGAYLSDYLKRNNEELRPIIGIGAAKLDENALAALVTYDEKYSCIYADKDFESKVAKFAEDYLISKNEAKEYIITHELMHATGRNNEAETEKATRDYFLDRAKTDSKYNSLAEVGDIRYRLANGEISEKAYDRQEQDKYNN